MDDAFAKRVRAAARAGWCTFVIFVIWMTAGWFVAVAMMHARPSWVPYWCGGDAFSWDILQTLSLLFFGAMKLLLFLLLFVVIWLTLWARRLKRAE